MGYRIDAALATRMTPFTPEIPDDPPQDDADLPEGTDFSISDFLNIKEDL